MNGTFFIFLLILLFYSVLYPFHKRALCEAATPTTDRVFQPRAWYMFVCVCVRVNIYVCCQLFGWHICCMVQMAWQDAGRRKPVIYYILVCMCICVWVCMACVAVWVISCLEKWYFVKVIIILLFIPFIISVGNRKLWRWLTRQHTHTHTHTTYPYVFEVRAVKILKI